MSNYSQRINTDTIKGYGSNYSASRFWNKVIKCAVKAGRPLLRKALILYYELSDSRVSAFEKTIIIGALGYFICPVDIIPDGIPVVGYADDLAAINEAFKLIESIVSPRIIRKVENKLDSIVA